MSICPICKKEINTLLWTTEKTIYGNVSIDNKEIEIDEEEEIINNTEYACPECDSILFRDYDYAEKFLKGGAR